MEDWAAQRPSLNHIDHVWSELDDRQCTTTHTMQAMNEDDITFGRRSNIIVTCEQDDRDIKLCSLEFKKAFLLIIWTLQDDMLISLKFQDE
ncbi:MAG: hypothetical protein EXX96DRAFT_622396 [Benjaminiella poitrasii]|nr:MAG: hypothetical protein EXX96DRAFT_622396 [Benjaminiella poitrasii]